MCINLNSNSIQIRKKGKLQGSNLLFVRCGSKLPLCLKEYFVSSDIIVVLSLYKNNDFIIHDEWWVLEGGYSKYHAAKLFLDEYKVFLNCDVFAFFDPDISIHYNNIIWLFKSGKNEKRGIYQASLKDNANVTWPFLKNIDSSNGWRETTFVEVMAPFFSQKALLNIYNYFDISISTWGLEYLWYYKCSDLHVGVYDNIIMSHESPVDTESGPFYMYLQKMNINPFEERESVKKKFNNINYIECDVPNLIPFKLKKYYVKLISKKNNISLCFASVLRAVYGGLKLLKN